ncbi:uncharacterized protein LOC106088603 [Stomoxys calcitrans]|uniref:uncharacterized protein LOC106088603 n=1 Tax=Stomoxys calcitrans TaxID=35570 RepID=UPI0027E2FFB8|nr:uncharacterized protein LOC106088603 [Stomoxys calcitrans]
MFDTISYIPTILAYIFISLLVTILGFIVIYVSHKIYVTIYDNLPVAPLSPSSSTKITQKIKTMSQPSALVCGPMGRKSKTALRIIVTLEPCYLAYMVFKIGYSALCSLPPPMSSTGPSSRQCLSTSQVIVHDPCTWVDHHNDRWMLKYYDNLSAIPICHGMRNQQICEMQWLGTGKQ